MQPPRFGPRYRWAMIDPTPSVRQLRDGTPVVVRAVRPSDLPLIESGFRALSPRSRLDRFLVPVQELGEERLAFLHQLDGSHQAAVGALTLQGQGVAIARFARVPGDPQAAEVGITVVDDYQGRGAGTLLFRELAKLAIDRGIRRFVGVVRAANRRAIDPLRRVASNLRPDGPGLFKFEVDLVRMVETGVG
jgi:RimJ/RimL family protein N-acetyltransferase